MAGDILLYQTDIVPIGDDQRQHLELTRDIAERFNSRFGETFKVPEGVYPEVGARIIPAGAGEQDVDDRRHGAGDGQLRRAGRIRKKFRSAVTDSGSEARRAPDKAGVTNLIDILSSPRRGARRDRGALRRRRLRPVQDRRGRCGGRGGGADPGALPRVARRRAGVAAAVRPGSGEGAGRRPEPTLESMYDRMGFVKSEAGRFFGAARPRSL